jgi:membrane protease YdiL (CAAX protease family)
VSTVLLHAFGAVVGAALFCGLARERPTLPRRRALAHSVVLVPAACVEEVVWRLGALGALRPLTGPVAALSLSSAGFALVHWRQAGTLSVRVHLVTGSAFGAAFLLTGMLTVAIAAHATYNVLVAAAVERGPPP